MQPPGFKVFNPWTCSHWLGQCIQGCCRTSHVARCGYGGFVAGNTGSDQMVQIGNALQSVLQVMDHGMHAGHSGGGAKAIGWDIG
mmetsp:Transcript_96178/g.165839  ORF Transcript_96178/g.165839 Transcript_96178/m.165839 type:complete len:85 (+) Transcript_96178:4670-4924(+)